MILATILLAAATLAQTDHPTSVADEPSPPAVKRVCRRFQVTGSNLPGKKYCLTREEWRTFHAQNGDAADAFLNRSRRGPDAMRLD